MRAQTSRMRGGRGGWKVCPIVTPAQRNGGGGRFCPIVTPSTRVRWREAGYEGDGERIAYIYLCTAKMCYICLFYWEKKENSPCFQANSLDKSFQILKKLLTLQQNIEYTEKKSDGNDCRRCHMLIYYMTHTENPWGCTQFCVKHPKHWCVVFPPACSIGADVAFGCCRKYSRCKWTIDEQNNTRRQLISHVPIEKHHRVA